MRYDAATGARSVLVAGSRLVPPGEKTGLAIDDYTWSADGRRLLIFTNTKKVWRDNTRGDYWVLGVEDGTLTKLGGSAPASSLMFAKFSPDATRVAYVRANNIYVERLSDHAHHPAHDRWIDDDHQRHLGLGLRGGARRARRVPLEPGRPRHRLLAVRQHGRRACSR